jgi:hypothetical protein
MVLTLNKYPVASLRGDNSQGLLYDFKCFIEFAVKEV